AGGLDFAEEQPDQRGLSGAIRADNPDAFAALDDDVDVPEDLPGAIGEGRVTCLENRVPEAGRGHGLKLWNTGTDEPALGHKLSRPFDARLALRSARLGA